MQTVAQRIIAALGPETGLPVAQGTYRGEADTYFVFNMDAIPEDFADDMPEHERYLIMLHLFAPFTKNLTSLQKRVKRAISGAGFTWPSMTDASETARSSDGTEQHLVFEFETAEGIEG